MLPVIPMCRWCVDVAAHRAGPPGRDRYPVAAARPARLPREQPGLAAAAVPAVGAQAVGGGGGRRGGGGSGGGGSGGRRAAETAPPRPRRL